MNRSLPILALALSLACVSVGLAQDPENERLPTKSFRRGLKQLGLTDLLDYYVREFPPDDPLQASLLKRELRLNLYADATVPAAERLQALAEATVILRDLISTYPDHADRFEWQLELGRDLIFRKAEPYHNNVMLRGGTEADRAALSRITSEALGVYNALIAELVAAESEIDRMSIKQFEKSAKLGYIQSIEEHLPKARYFRLWASYYYCLTLPPSNPKLAKSMREIIQYLNEDSKLTSIDHAISHYQAQSLLLAGMAYRLLNSSALAEEVLSKAAAIVVAIPNYTERQSLRWVTTFSALERVKNFRDTNQYELALRALNKYRAQLPSSSPDQFSLVFALALLEGTIYRDQAESLAEGASARKAELLLKSRQPLIDLARQQPRYQDEIYATLFEMLGAMGDISSLDSFEQSVYLAGLLRRAGQTKRKLQAERATLGPAATARLDSEKDKLLAQAATLATTLLEDESALGLELRPEVRFNLAVCRFEQGRTLEAIMHFNLLAKDHVEFGKSKQAMEYAIRLCESLYRQAGRADRQTIRPHYLQALEQLLSVYRHSSLAKGRQYIYARVLQEDARYAEAAEQYVLVAADDPKYLEALFHTAECHLMLLRRTAAHEDQRAASSQATVTLESVARFQQKRSAADAAEMSRYSAEVRLISAEANMLRPAKDAGRALQNLADFELEFPNELDLIGRAMRIRILAYQELGELEQAAAIIPDYLERDPLNAGGTLQGLLYTLKAEVAVSEQAGRIEDAARKAEDALVVAKALYEWGVRPASGLDRAGQLAFKLEYGEALLKSKRPDEASEVFRSAVREDAAAEPDGRSHSGRALYGLASAYLDGSKPHDALPYFSRLYSEAAEDSELWWKAFLGEIHCRMALEQDSETLYKLISQKRVFYPHMGGTELKREFERLRSELSSRS